MHGKYAQINEISDGQVIWFIRFRMKILPFLPDGIRCFVNP